jgi:crossover junction endodeoxyribonuclease RuvC
VKTSPATRILGIDPGSRFLGWGVIEGQGAQVQVCGVGVIRTDPQDLLHLRLKSLADQLTQVFNVFSPTEVAVEGVFTNKNARSALVLGHARGVALLIAAQAGSAVFEYAPARVKRSLGAGGNDSKEAVARMVSTWLHLKEPLARADAYDALAVALCHLSQSRVKMKPGRTVSIKDRMAPAFVAPARRA